MKMKPKQLHRSLALPPNKDASVAKKHHSNHQCSTAGLQSDPSIFVLWGKGGDGRLQLRTPIQEHARAWIKRVRETCIQEHAPPWLG